MTFNPEEYNASAKSSKSFDHFDNEIKAHKLKCSELDKEIKEINTRLAYIKAYKMLTDRVVFREDDGLLVTKPANYIEGSNN